MIDDPEDAKNAVVTSAAILHEIITLYDKCGLAVAGAHLSAGLDAACRQTGLDRSDLALPFNQARKSGAIN